MTDPTLEDVSYPGADGAPVTGVASRPATAGGPGILFLHWGFGDRRSFAAEARAYAAAGACCLSIDAPGRGLRGGPTVRLDRADAAKAFLDRCVDDLGRGLDWLVAQGAGARRLAYVGHSLGASVGGAFVGSAPRLAAAVLAGGYGDVSREGWSPKPSAAFTAALAPYDATRLLPQVHAPLLLQFAQRDPFVSHASAQRLAAAVGSRADVRWYDVGHALDGAATDERGAWLAERLGLKVPGPGWLAAVRPPLRERVACALIGPLYGPLWRLAGR